MNKIFLSLLLLFSATTMFAQAPDAFNYQAVARDNAGNALANQSIAVRLSVHTATSGGSIVYQERQTATTNAFGLFSCQIGTGTVLSGTFAGVDWKGGLKFLQVELDPAGGTSYIDMGTTQLVSVPYAKVANELNVFASGTSNPDKMVIIHSPAYPTWGLQYQDVGDKFNFIGNGSPALSIGLSSLNVGIGTNSPNYQLHVHAPTGSQTAFAQFTNVASGTSITNGVRIGLNNTGEGVFSIDGNHPLRFLTNNAEIVTITGGGKVGIGNTSPASLLDVAGSSAAASDIGLLTINNAGTGNAINATSTGGFLASSAAVSGNNTGGGSGVFGQATTGGYGIYGYNASSGGVAGHFEGNVENTGYTKLGSSAPAIKTALFTGTTASTQGGSVTLSLGGIDVNKVVSITGMVQYVTDGYVPDNYNFNGGYNFSFYIFSGNLYVVNDYTSSGYILSKPFKIFVTYQQ